MNCFFLRLPTRTFVRLTFRSPIDFKLQSTLTHRFLGIALTERGERWPFIISGLLLTPSGKVFNKGAQHTAHLRSVIVSLALEQHRASHNDRLPQRLQELVPELLGEIQSDPFDGKPMRYKRLPKGYVVYSVGPDGHDNDGREKKTLSNLQKMSGVEQPYDITFTVER